MVIIREEQGIGRNVFRIALISSGPTYEQISALSMSHTPFDLILWLRVDICDIK
jgi:hypothetical protein